MINVDILQHKLHNVPYVRHQEHVWNTYVLKIFQTKIMKNQETVYLKWREIVLEKRVFHLYNRGPLFDKTALG